MYLLEFGINLYHLFEAVKFIQVQAHRKFACFALICLENRNKPKNTPRLPKYHIYIPAEKNRQYNTLQQSEIIIIRMWN